MAASEEIESQVFLDGRVTLLGGDCLEVLKTLPENSVDTIITDPPYHFQTIVKRFGGKKAAPAGAGTDGLFARASAGFMGKQWDGGDIAFRPETWEAAQRVLKPGGHLAAFSAPKCVHKMGMAIEMAGFEIRDRAIHLFDLDPHVVAFLESLTAAQADSLFRLIDHFGALGEAFWVFGSGFPKSHDVSKAIDKLKGAEREKVPAGKPVKRIVPGAQQNKAGWEKNTGREYQPGEEIPATPEAEQWNGWGTALKPAYEPIVIARKPLEGSVAANTLKHGTGGINIDGTRIGTRTASTGEVVSENRSMSGGNYGRVPTGETTVGRFPSNLTHDGSQAATEGFPEAGGGNGESRVAFGIGGNGTALHGGGKGAEVATYADSGSAARFFYTAKADSGDRIGSKHPTVKPVDLMQWLCRMLCRKGGTVLDIFSGTGTTGEAAWREGMDAILIEREAEYRADIARRMAVADKGPQSRREAIAAEKARRAAEAGATESDAEDIGLLAMLGEDAPPIVPETGGGNGR